MYKKRPVVIIATGLFFIALTALREDLEGWEGRVNQDLIISC